MQTHTYIQTFADGSNFKKPGAPGLKILLLSNKVYTFVHCYTVQFNLNLIKHACERCLKRHINFFIEMHASMHVYARLMMLNLLFKVFVYALDVCTTDCSCTHACQENTHQI